MKDAGQDTKVCNIVAWGVLFVCIVISGGILLFVRNISTIICLLLSTILLLGLFIHTYIYVCWKKCIWFARFTMAVSCIMAVVLNSFLLWLPQVLLVCAFVMVYKEVEQQKDFFSISLSGIVVFEIFSILNSCKVIGIQGMIGAWVSSYVVDIVFVVLFIIVAFYENYEDRGKIWNIYFKNIGVVVGILLVAIIMTVFIGACAARRNVDKRKVTEIRNGSWIILQKVNDAKIVRMDSDSYLIEGKLKYSKQNIFHLSKIDDNDEWNIKDFMGRILGTKENAVYAGENVRFLSSNENIIDWRIIDVPKMGIVFEAAENMYLNVEEGRAYLQVWNGLGNNLFNIEIFRNRLEYVMYSLEVQYDKIETLTIIFYSIVTCIYGIIGNVKKKK